MKNLKKRMEDVCIYVISFVSVSVFITEIIEWLLFV